MQIDKPSWRLKIDCPHCGQGFPVFVFCPDCGYLTVQCDETGDTFLNPRKLQDGFIDICPKCNKVETNRFVISDYENILNVGFTKEEYE